MAPKPNRERRAQILTAARHVFGEKGYAGAAVADIVRAAGVAQGTFYLYFPSKQDAFFALAEDFYAGMAAHVNEALAREGDLEQRVGAITHSCFAAARENADLVRLVFFGADSASAEAQRRFAERNPVVDAVRGMIDAAVADGAIEIADPEVAARLVVGMVRNAMLETFVLGDGSDAERLERATAAMFAGALGVSAK